MLVIMPMKVPLRYANTLMHALHVPLVVHSAAPAYLGLQRRQPSILPQLGAHSVIALGAVCNVLLALLKFGVGTLGGSAALVADAAHSASDILVDAICLLGASSPAFERICLLIVAV